MLWIALFVLFCYIAAIVASPIVRRFSIVAVGCCAGYCWVFYRQLTVNSADRVSKREFITVGQERAKEEDRLAYQREKERRSRSNGAISSTTTRIKRFFREGEVDDTPISDPWQPNPLVTSLSDDPLMRKEATTPPFSPTSRKEGSFDKKRGLFAVLKSRHSRKEGKFIY
jgi:hypothetical protein